MSAEQDSGGAESHAPRERMWRRSCIGPCLYPTLKSSVLRLWNQLQKWVDQKFGTAAATHWRIYAGALSRQLTEECDHLRDKYILEIVALVQTLVQSYQPRQSSGALETTRG